jgi:hypothetical protein
MRIRGMSRFQLYALDRSKPDEPAPRHEVFIALGEHSVVDGRVVVTDGCRSGTEVDEWVDRLITQLNAIRHKAKEKLADRLKE